MEIAEPLESLWIALECRNKSKLWDLNRNPNLDKIQTFLWKTSELAVPPTWKFGFYF